MRHIFTKQSLCYFRYQVLQMLSAEHWALEHKAVKQLLDIRQREVEFITQRFNSIGTQSSLIAALVCTLLVGLDPGAPSSEAEDESVRQIFWASSALALILSLHCILNSTFACVWGPGLALRGPTGSVSKAYAYMVRERAHINIAFVASLFFLLIQSIMAFFILDWKKGFSTSSTTALIILVGGASVSAFLLRRMNQRFYYLQSNFAETDDDPDVILDAGKKEQKNDNQTRLLTATIPLQSNQESPFSHQGYLLKKGRVLRNWTKRYFVLKGGSKLHSWDTKEDYLERAGSPSKVINLKGYQILVRESQLRFVLESIGVVNDRNREFKCINGHDLKDWVGALVSSSLVAQ